MKQPTRSEWGNPYTHEEHSRTTWTAIAWSNYSYRPSIMKFSCDWCGCEKQRLYSYDGDDMHKFCNKECKEAYR